MMIAVNKPGYFGRSEVGPDLTGFFSENGYAIVYDALTAVEIEQLKEEAAAICRHDRGPLQISGGGTRPDIASLKSISDDEVIAQFLCIHNAHKTSPLIHSFLKHPTIVAVLTRLIGRNIKSMQSMLFIKSAGKPGQAWHQDEDFIPTRDRSLTGAWIAIDDATVANGCLWVLPGSHKSGVLWPMYPHDDLRYDCTQMSYDFPYSESDAVPVEVPAGAIVFFNGYTLHKSEPNTLKAGFRRVLVNHYMSAESLLPWKNQSTLTGVVAQADHRDIVMIAGEDPYAWKGTEDILRPHVRASGEGGCGDGRHNLSKHREQVAKNLSKTN